LWLLRAYVFGRLSNSTLHIGVRALSFESKKGFSKIYKRAVKLTPEKVFE